MKLSEYARERGISYKTAWRMWKAGSLDAYQLATGTIIVRQEAVPQAQRVALYARVSSADQKYDAARQLGRLRDYAAARGYRVAVEVTEIASGLNDNRPKLGKILADQSITIIVVEHRDRLTRFGWQHISTLMTASRRQLEAVDETDTGDELVDDFVAVITSMAARIYGRRNSKRRAAAIKRCVEIQMQTADGVEDDDPAGL